MSGLQNELVPELLQGAATPEAMAAAIEPLLAGTAAATQQQRGFEQLGDRLRQGFGDRAATALTSLLESRYRG